MAGNNIRCVAKYLFDKGYVPNEDMTVETKSGVHRLKLFLRDGKVSSVAVDMGAPTLDAAAIPVVSDTPTVVNKPTAIAGGEYALTCVSVGNPHCVVFCDALDALDLAELGPRFENAPIFPERVNTEFVRVVDPTTLRVRVWERGNGETLACGTGAAAAVVAAVENGFCEKGKDVTVKLAGGDMTVNYTGDRVTLVGSAVMVYEGEFEY